MHIWIRRECMPVKSNEKLEWKYDCKLCVCEEIETERHVLQECKNYEKESYGKKGGCSRWVMQICLKGYLECGKEMDACIRLVYMGKIWCIREKNETVRLANV